MGLINMAAEIGVAQGRFSKHLLTHWKGFRLNMVDPYSYQGGKLDRSDSTEQHESNYQAARKLEREFKGRAVLIPQPSIVAAKWHFDGELDFVYIDAKHDYRSVWADLAAWYPKVKVGGIIAGHDYKNSFVRRNLVEVKRAVDFWALMSSEKIQVTTDDNLPSWWCVKTQVV